MTNPYFTPEMKAGDNKEYPPSSSGADCPNCAERLFTLAISALAEESGSDGRCTYCGIELAIIDGLPYPLSE